MLPLAGSFGAAEDEAEDEDEGDGADEGGNEIEAPDDRAPAAQQQ